MVQHLHGKTTLTKALSGIWTDTHSEETKRGISIRLGYADITFRRCTECPEPLCYTTAEICENCGKETQLLRKVSFVDSPGHETLMWKMRLHPVEEGQKIDLRFNSLNLKIIEKHPKFN